MHKISIRFYNDIAVRTVWNDETNSWFFSALDVVAAIRNERDYNKVRNYWKYLKSKLQKEDSRVVSVTNQLKIVALDGKKRLSDTLNAEGIILLAKNFPSNLGAKFLDWFTDGLGWNSTRNNLKETFDVLETVYNIADLENDVLARI